MGTSARHTGKRELARSPDMVQHVMVVAILKGNPLFQRESLKSLVLNGNPLF